MIAIIDRAVIRVRRAVRNFKDEDRRDLRESVDVTGIERQSLLE
jgi:hypothetical protein